MKQVLTGGLLIFPLCLQKVKYMHSAYTLSFNLGSLWSQGERFKWKHLVFNYMYTASHKTNKIKTLQTQDWDQVCTRI